MVDPAGTLQTSAPSATYRAASLELNAFTALQAARQAAGAGLLHQSAQLDIASQAHAAYLTANLAVATSFHLEDQALPGYYATSPGDRVSKAGYSVGYATEVVGGTGASLQGADCVLGLLNTVYHATALLGRATHVGIGFGFDVAGIPMCVADLAATSTDTYGQVLPAGSLMAYPYDGQTGVLEGNDLTTEVPRPPTSVVPDGSIVGTPVIVGVRNADFVNFKAAGTLNVVVAKFELKDAGGNLVPAGILASTGIAGSGVALTVDAQLADGWLVLVPRASLVKGTTYTATFTATLKAGGTPVTKTWSFTTTTN